MNPGKLAMRRIEWFASADHHRWSWPCSHLRPLSPSSSTSSCSRWACAYYAHLLAS
jgi:hypothetical protein